MVPKHDKYLSFFDCVHFLLLAEQIMFHKKSPKGGKRKSAEEI
jgi:hypothetical protein